MSKILPRISIITPSFNQSKYLEKSIISILEQEYPNLEYIVIDGGSTDNSVEIIKKYEKHLKFWVSEPDKGQSHAINKGLKHATGDIINWLNSDDSLTKRSLFKIAEIFQSNEIDIVCGYSKLIYPDKNVLLRTTDMRSDFTKNFANCHFMQPSTFFRKSVFDNLVPLEETLHYMMDHYIWLKYLLVNELDKIFYTDNVIADVLVHENAKSVQQIDKFKIDKQRIYNSFFKSVGYSNKSFGHSDNLLPFEFSIVMTQKQLRLIDFYLMRYNLFKYNDGERQNLNIPTLLNLFIHFPWLSIKKIFK